jgi:hypothetical protein
MKNPSDRVCKIVPVGKRRDGGTRFWCIFHKADATAKYGVEASRCRYADIPAISASEEIAITLSDFGGGVAFWGAVPPIYDTSTQPLDRGIHVHARKVPGGEKIIDQTYRKVRVRRTGEDSAYFELSELDAIYYMVSSVFGHSMKEVRCTHCDYSHLDKDWFSLHPHHRHLCAGCGNYFRDSTDAVGNPLKGLQEKLGHKLTKPKKSKRRLEISQSDYPGGIQIWGSNPAIFWTGQFAEEDGIHVHVFDEKGEVVKELDNTYSKVVVDGVELYSTDVRAYMAQNILPHINGRTTTLYCTDCGQPHRSTGAHAYTPTDTHVCSNCGTSFRTRGKLRRMISNPVADQILALARFAPTTIQKFDLKLIPETL